MLDMPAFAAKVEADVVIAVLEQSTQGRTNRDALSGLSKLTIGLLSSKQSVSPFGRFHLIRGQVAWPSAILTGHS